MQFQQKVKTEDPRMKRFTDVQKQVEKSAVSLAAGHLQRHGRTILTKEFMEQYKVRIK